MYIDDCVERHPATIMHSDVAEPINLGSSELVTINQLVDIVEEIAGIKLKRRYNLTRPKGVRGRNSDNTLIEEQLGWEPSTRLRDGHGEDLRVDLRPDDQRAPRGSERSVIGNRLSRWPEGTSCACSQP